VGLALGLVAVLFLGRQFEGLGAGLIAGGALRWIDWLLLALVPIAGVFLAMITARLAVVRALRRMLWTTSAACSGGSPRCCCSAGRWASCGSR